MRLYTHRRMTPRWIPNWRNGGDPPLPGFTITWLWWSWCFNRRAFLASQQEEKG